MKKFISFASVITLTLMLLVFSCGQAPQMPTPAYQTLKTKLTTETINEKFTAKLKGIQDVSILPRVSGNITQICTTEGAVIKQGQTLFVIDQRPYELNVKTQEANVLSRKAELATAKLNLESNEGLFQKKIISRYAYETAKNNYSNAQAALELAQTQLATAKNDLSYCTVKSPVNGVVGVIPYRVGDLVSQNVSQPLTTVSDVSKVTAYFSITEGNYLAITKNIKDPEQFKNNAQEKINNMPPVKLLLNDGSYYEKEGKISSISGLVDELTGTLQCKAEFGNPYNVLRSGISASVVFSYNEPDLMLVPQTAVNQMQNKSIVYVLQRDSTVKATVVEIREMNDGKNYIITKGLDEGAEIVASGLNTIADGMKIAVKK